MHQRIFLCVVVHPKNKEENNINRGKTFLCDRGNRGINMSDIQQTKSKIDALNGKLKQMSSEVARGKTEVDRGISLSKMIVTLGEQNSLVAEQNYQLSKIMKGVK